MVDKIDIDNGKYSVIIGSDNGNWTFKALRYGEEWIENLTLAEGSNMIMAMAYEIQRLRSQLETIKELDDALIELKHVTD